MDTPRAFVTAEEWRVKYAVVTADITNPAVIENAERAARIVMDLAASGIYSLPVCTGLMLQLIHAFYMQDQAATPSADTVLRALHRAAEE